MVESPAAIEYLLQIITGTRTASAPKITGTPQPPAPKITGTQDHRHPNRTGTRSAGQSACAP